MLPPLPDDIDPTRLKFFSTDECSCIDDDGAPLARCRGDCWEWERLDLDETLRPWFASTLTGWFGIADMVIRLEGGGVGRDRGFAHVNDAHELVDFLIGHGDDFTMYYETPCGFEWRFWQYSPYEDRAPGDEWVRVKVFHACSRFGDNSGVDEMIDELEAAWSPS